MRTRLRRLLGEAPSALPTVLAHVAALFLVSVLAKAGVVPHLAAAAFLILHLRAAVGLRARPGAGSAVKVGVGEIGYGAVTVLLVAVGRLLG